MGMKGEICALKETRDTCISTNYIGWPYLDLNLKNYIKIYLRQLRKYENRQDVWWYWEINDIFDVTLLLWLGLIKQSLNLDIYR